jgi:hypothetical protein
MTKLIVAFLIAVRTLLQLVLKRETGKMSEFVWIRVELCECSMCHSVP